MNVVEFQTGVDCLGFPTITRHEIVIVSRQMQNGNRYLPKTINFMKINQTHLVRK